MAVTRFLARDLAIAIETVAEVAGTPDSLTTPFGVAATDVLTATAHGLADDTKIVFQTLAGGAGLAIDTDYYIRDATANDFKLALAPGQAAVNFTTDITAGGFTPYTAATFTPILGLNSLTHAASTNRADAGGFDSVGRAKHLVTERGDTWTLAGHALEDVATGARDPGQAAVEALAKLTGPSALKNFKMTSPGGNAIVFSASAENSLPGGGHNDIASWGTTLEVDGSPLYIPAS
jgi:hypothetical protein